MTDPTYVKADIDAKQEWREAFRLSELYNDDAPIGWSRCIGMTETEAKHLYLPALATENTRYEEGLRG